MNDSIDTRGNGAIDHSPELTLVHQANYDPDGNWELATVIVYAIAAARGVSPADLKSPVLYDCVDVAALEDAFFGADVNGASRDGIGSSEFYYGETLVRVRNDGWVEVYEAR